jgi:hypothetical protein
MLLPAPNQEPIIPNDLQDYLNAARRLQKRQGLYPEGSLDRVEFYQYSPAYALAFAPFLWLPPVAVAFIHTLLHIAVYVFLYVCWERMLRQTGLERVSEMMSWTLPLWLVFSAFWSDLGYLNVYIIMALFATFLIHAILNERLGTSLFWLSLILQIKPQWAFAAFVPLLLGRRRFFLKLLVLAVVVYAAIVGLTMVAVGTSYAWQQYGNYFQFLWSMRRNFPWRGPEAPFLGYNHSITQITTYLLGVSPGPMHLALAIKTLLLVPLALVALNQVRRPVSRAGYDVLQRGLDFGFVLYLAAFIWLDMVWEVSLGIVVFTYLIATCDRQNARGLMWAVFLPYALVDLWQLVNFALFGPDVVLPGLYILTDYSIYIPLSMIVILVFYGILVRRLWVAVPAR